MNGTSVVKICDEGQFSSHLRAQRLVVSLERRRSLRDEKSGSERDEKIRFRAVSEALHTFPAERPSLHKYMRE